MTQLPVFLDVYATSGYLTEDMKDNILHLADLATDDEDDEGGSASRKAFNEQLSICMEIGSFSGEVPAEIRTRIRRLSELILQQNAYSNKADIWSQMLLKLHGILINGGGPVQPVNLVKRLDKQEPVPEIASIEEVPATDAGAELNGEDVDAALSQEDGLDEITAEMEEEEPEEEMEEEGISPAVKNCWPAKLRLILPVGDGAEQELDLGNLFIASDPKKKGNGHKKVSTRKRK
jgi:hypothetical protein